MGTETISLMRRWHAEGIRTLRRDDDTAPSLWNMGFLFRQVAAPDEPPCGTYDAFLGLYGIRKSIAELERQNPKNANADHNLSVLKAAEQELAAKKVAITTGFLNLGSVEAYRPAKIVGQSGVRTSEPDI